jgi:hypothetical protein
MVLLAVVVLVADESCATVYTWIEDGVSHFTNSAGEVPEPHRATAKSFPTAAAPVATAVKGAARDERSEPDERLVAEAAYDRGVERGAAIALAQTRAVGELARSLVETALQSEPAWPAGSAPPRSAPSPSDETHRPRRERPEFRVSIVPSRDRWPGGVFYGFAGPIAGCPGCCCASGLGFGLGRLVPHSHFFPSLAGARRAPLFFPHGHQLDGNAFLVGRAYWVN